MMELPGPKAHRSLVYEVKFLESELLLGKRCYCHTWLTCLDFSCRWDWTKKI